MKGHDHARLQRFRPRLPSRLLGSVRAADRYSRECEGRQTPRLFAFIMANQNQPLDGEPADYLVAVDLVEALSGLDFYSALPDSLEDLLEEEVAFTWPQQQGIDRWN